MTSWLARCRRPHRLDERKAVGFLAFTSIACTLICYRWAYPGHPQLNRFTPKTVKCAV